VTCDANRLELGAIAPMAVGSRTNSRSISAVSAIVNTLSPRADVGLSNRKRRESPNRHHIKDFVSRGSDSALHNVISEVTSHRRGQVIVTGASTGIGRATALHLHGLGFSVLAAVRSDEDAERLRQHGVTPLLLDITSPEQLAAAHAQLGSTPLVGLVNNAAVSMFGPLEFTSTEDLHELFDVNVVGQVGVIQTFLDRLRDAHGRIINVGSISGRFSRPVAGAYDASKFAVRAINDSLRRELSHQGIDVVLIEPGGIKTAILGKITDRLKQLSDDRAPGLKERYGAMIDSALKSADKAERHSSDPSVVAKVIGTALTAPRPRTRYLIGQDAHVLAAMTKLPDRMVDRILLKKVKA